MDIGIFGGSFNPPHLAHLIVAEVVRDQFGLEEVWWIPSRQPPHKPGASLAPARDRLEMTRQATAGHPAFQVKDLEIRRSGTSYTIDTICALQEVHPDMDFALIIGSDSLHDFASWRRPEDIVERVPLIVYKRPGAVLAPRASYFAGRVHFADAPLLEISGTEIRARRRQGRSVRYLVPEAVRAYMEAHGLYVAEPGER